MAISVIQTITKTGSASPLSVSFGSGTRAGSCVIIAFGATNSGFGPSLSGMTAGGTSLSSLANSSGNAIGSEYVGLWVYALPNCPAGQTALSVTGSNFSGGAGFAAYEVGGLAQTTATLLDKSSTGTGNNGSDTSSSSGTTATTTNPNELVLGACAAWSGSQTGPTSPWSNLTATYLTAGYQIVSSDATFSYATTWSGGGPWASAVVTLFPGANIFTRNVMANQAVMRSAIF